MTEIIITVVNLAFSAFTFYLGLRIGRQQREEDHREARIDRVVTRYVELANTGRDSGPHALIAAGIRDLMSDGEYRDALLRVVDRLGRHPLGGDAARLSRADLRQVFAAFEVESLAVRNYKQVISEFSDPVG